MWLKIMSVQVSISQGLRRPTGMAVHPGVEDYGFKCLACADPFWTA
jgi:hypothetical protein